MDYNPQEIEEKAQHSWAKKQLFNVTEDLNKEKFYCLSMFPYPSGTLHMGHVRNYTIGDVIARYQRAQGKNVLQPIGWDAFGLPAENAAIKHNIHPAEWTEKNIQKMREQFLRLGNAYDWRREINTSSPEYYRWEQWFFLKLYEKGLVYKKNALVNWDPVDKTVLANEQVVDGRGWRSGALIEHKEISQWFIKITAYADELLEGLDSLKNWPPEVKQMQRNWIGRSEGTEIYFKVANHQKRLKVYTTRADTLMGATYIAIAQDHPLTKEIMVDNPSVAEFVASCKNISLSEVQIAREEKRGVDTGYKAIHPLTLEEIPIWVANYVLMQYGSGAVMAVPMHDERDFEFAKQYNLPKRQVIKPDEDHDFSKNAYTGEGRLINSHQFDNLTNWEAKHAITDELIRQNAGDFKVNYRLRDWGVSRQRYWGTPIPIINCESCGHVPVPEADLPVVLPQNVSFTKGSPLASCAEFVNTICPKCGQDAERETDTFDTFVESSWYYARFACRGQDNVMLDDRAKYWTPVDQYIGGIEHACMHLLYARFFHKLMRDEGLVNSDEPFNTLLTQGMVLKDGHKMSKSKGNTVDPNALIKTYGADTARLFSMFAAPPDQSLEWSDAGVEGAYRFLKKLFNFAYVNKIIIIEINESIRYGNYAENPNFDSKLEKAQFLLNQNLAQINQDYERQHFNTVVSGCMKIFNILSSYHLENEFDPKFIHYGLSVLLRTLAPITPHICYHIWQELEYDKSVIDAPWPKVDKSALRTAKSEYVIQVNGKLRGQFVANNEASEEELIKTARDEVASFLTDKSIMKAIVVGHRKLINLVVKP